MEYIIGIINEDVKTQGGRVMYQKRVWDNCRDSDCVEQEIIEIG